MSTMEKQDIQGKKEFFASVGSIGNCLLFVSTIAITFCLLKRFPDESYFDTTWLEHGFCIANPDSAWWNSHALSFYSDTVMALGLVAFYYYTKTSCSVKVDSVPPLQEAMLTGSIPAVFFHGTGHIFYSLLDPSRSDFRIRLAHRSTEAIAAQINNFFGLAGIFHGTMALAPFSRLVLAALLATVGISLLDVPTHMLFVYTQGVIYVTSSLHMLSLDRQHKQTAVYMLYPWLQFPVLALGIMESTICQSVMAPVGGHLLFDTTISLGVFGGQILARRMESGLNAPAHRKVA